MAAAAAAAIRQVVIRSSPSPLLRSVRLMATSSSPPPRHRLEPHEFSRPSDFLGSWDPSSSSDPREAQKRLALLRRDYEKQVRDLRKQYIYEMELQRQEKLLKDEAKREAIRLAKEERKAAKSAIAQSRAAERKIVEDEFRQTLLKERSEKLEFWKAREAMMEQKRSDKNELLRRQSSMWVDEEDLEKKIVEAFTDTTTL
ncbi:hypothetical protein CKAN_02298100 [Cinnamomum micranthum f. kanehirae]|uniref:Uncharacterized protein n=1 Tax=Cinnamomum micranthum f. kanehirae TaxID=337451 RepID=A0A443PSL9_9MAGN|nr:hypothetical protein CKAN_02298100 [Cinnamomum micranthum f. kanehirae]